MNAQVVDITPWDLLPFPSIIKGKGRLLLLDDVFQLFKTSVCTISTHILNFALCNFIEHSYG